MSKDIQVSPGPVFDKKPFPKKLTINLLVALGLILVIVLVANRPQNTPSEITNLNGSPGIISVEVNKNDGYAKISRKAISKYLQDNQDRQLSDGQRLFIEEKLRRKIVSQPLLIGGWISLRVADIEESIELSRQLSQIQINTWENLAKEIKF